MPKTSIDGLPVRSSRSQNRSTESLSSRRVVSDIRVAPQKSDGTRRKATGTNTESRRRISDDFVSPVHTLEMDDAYENGQAELDSFSEVDDLSTMDEAAWTELLDNFGSDNEPTKKAQKRRDSAKSRDDNNVEEDEAPRRSRTRQPKRHKKPHLPKRPFLLRHPILTTCVILILSLGVGIYIWGDSLISRLTNGNSGLWDAVGAMLSEEVPFETDANGRTNVLVFGTEGYDMDGTSGDGKHDGAQLTDSIMVVSFDQKTQDVALISLPRDLKVSMACSAGKINEVFWCHNKDGANDAAGATALMQQLEIILGINFQYWAHVNWGSLIQIVDTIGGITVTLDEDINDIYYTGIVIKAGEPTELDGYHAVALARARHGTQGGDFTRGISQQKIIEGIVAKLVNQGVNLSEAFSLVNILGDNLRSNFSTDNIKAGVRLISGFNPAAIRSIPLVDNSNYTYYVKTATIDGISYVVPSTGDTNYVQIQNYIKQMLSSNAAAREGATISIYNATDESGVAGAEQAALEAEGFAIDHVGDAESGTCAEKYCIYAATDKPGTRAALEKRYSVAAKDLAESPIAAGTDFIIVIGQTQ